MTNPAIGPIELRLSKTSTGAIRVIVVYPGVGNTSVHLTADWKDWVRRYNYAKVPRVWG